MTAQGVGELAVGCERCHGPGSKHVDIAKQKAAAGLKLDPKESFIVHGLKDLSLDQQNQVCGQCHARVGNKDQGELAFQNKWFVNGTACRAIEDSCPAIRTSTNAHSFGVTAIQLDQVRDWTTSGRTGAARRAARNGKTI